MHHIVSEAGARPIRAGRYVLALTGPEERKRGKMQIFSGFYVSRQSD